MSLTIQLLGRPRLVRHASDGEAYRFRSRKSWAVLTYLILSDRSPTRSQLASLLFAEADDPVRALRWCLSEIRRGLGDDGSVTGDPVRLRLSSTALVDVDIVVRGSWSDAVHLPELGSQLLDGLVVREAAAFETWLALQQHHVAGASEAVLREAALRSMSRGALDTAIDYAGRAVAMNPLDENHQALLIRLYRRRGDDDAAARQFAACVGALEDAFGTAPGAVVRAAWSERRPAADARADDATISALVEVGAAAVSAGAAEAGRQSLETAARLADAADITALRIRARLALAETLIHSLGGHDEEGLASLVEADDIALSHDQPEAVAQARAELGYVDFLRARYDRAEVWLRDAYDFAGGSPSTTAKAATYLGSVASDRADYPRALTLLEDAVALSRQAEEPRREAFGLAMLGRLHLLRDDLDDAAEHLDAAIGLAERDHWLSFVPFPQALRGEVLLRRHDLERAADVLRPAFALACQLGDPCWEGISARALALLAESSGDVTTAFDTLVEARVRANRHSDPYVWLDGYILDAQCELGRRYNHPDAADWVRRLHDLASRTGMRELTVRALVHGSALGHDGSAAAAALLAEDIVSRPLAALVAHG